MRWKKKEKMEGGQNKERKMEEGRREENDRLWLLMTDVKNVV